MIAGLCAGMALGLCVAAPVGPAAMLCIQRAATGGMALALPTGFGVATVHGLYAGAAAFGFAWLADVIARGGPWLRLVSAAVFLWIGLSAIVATARAQRRPAAPPRPTETAALRAYASTLLVALANPMTPALFLGLAPGLITGGAAAEPAVVTLGAFLGSASWWAGLSGCVCLCRRRVSTLALGRLNGLIGAILVACGLIGFGAAGHAILAAHGL